MSTFDPYPFNAAAPPTVEDLEVALGVLAYSAQVRNVMGFALRDRPFTPTPTDPLNLAAGVLREVGPYIAVPNAEDDDADDAPDAETEAVQA